MNLTDHRILAGHIKYLREYLNENYVEFAQRLGVSVAEVCNFEIATRRPGPEASQKLYDAAVEAKLPKLEDYFKQRADGIREWAASMAKLQAAMKGGRK